MFDAVLSYLRNSGALGMGALVLGALLLVAGVVMLTSRAARARFAAFLALSLLPVALGAVGAVIGNAAVDRALAAGDNASPAQIEDARRIAASALEIGAGATAVLLVVGLIGFALASDHPTGERAASAH